MPGAEDTIKRLRDAGVRVCLATGFSPVTRDAIVDELAWRGLIDLALSPADAGRGRPWPDLPLTALLRLRGGAVGELAVAGDTASDIESGRRAGAAIVASVLTGACTRDDLEQAGARHPRHDRGSAPLRHQLTWRGATRTGWAGSDTETDAPGASPADSALGRSAWTATSPDSCTPTRVTEPRKVLVVAIPLPFSTTSSLEAFRATSTSTAASSGLRPPDRHGAASAVTCRRLQFPGYPVHHADELGHERGQPDWCRAHPARRSARACLAAGRMTSTTSAFMLPPAATEAAVAQLVPLAVLLLVLPLLEPDELQPTVSSKLP